MPNGNDTVEIPWSNGRYDITHPDSQRQGARVYLSGLAQDAFRVDRLSLQGAKNASSTIVWLTNYQLARMNAQNDMPYDVEIHLEPGVNTNSINIWLFKGGSPEQISDVTRRGNIVRFSLTSADPSIGIS